MGCTHPDFVGSVERRLKELAVETDEVKRSAFFREYLDVMSKFWRYSYHNQLLIYWQCKHASHVAGFAKWRTLGRRIRRGSKAIKILAPFVRKLKEVDPSTQQEVEKALTLFHPVSVFDISQTQGRPLPDVSITVNGHTHQELLTKLVQFCNGRGIKLSFEDLGVNSAYGYSQGGKIVVSCKESVNSQVNILLHEIAHEVLHKEKERKEMSKQQREIQAEGTAYVVGKHFGLEAKSFNYLALYDADYKKIMENLAAIGEASGEVIGWIEGHNGVPTGQVENAEGGDAQ
jgi:antirestriction protein ArdC